MSLLQLLIFTNVTTTLSACKRVDVNDGNASISTVGQRY